MYDHVTLSMAKAYQERRLEEARVHHALKAAGLARPRLRDRLFACLGAWLISAGLRLQKRYTPVVQAAPETCQSVAGKASV